MRRWPFFCTSQWEGVFLSESQWKAEAYWPLIWMESIWLQKGHSMFSHPHWKYLETSLKKFYFLQVTLTSCLLRSVSFYFVLTSNADNATGIATRFIEMKLSKSSCFNMFTVDQVWSIVTNIWLNIRTFVIRKPFLSLQNVLIFRENFCLVFYSCNVQFRRVSINFMHEVLRCCCTWSEKYLFTEKVTFVQNIFFCDNPLKFSKRTRRPEICDMEFGSGVAHRVYRVSGFLACRLDWVPPLSPTRECCSSTPWVQGGRNTCLRGRDGGT